MIRKATPNDTRILAELAIQMWSNHAVSELEADFAEIVNSNEAVCFIKYVDDVPVGFARCQLRHDYVEGTHSSPVGYLEGIFVVPEYQHKGYAKELLLECELWAKENKIEVILLNSGLPREDAHAFYESQGYFKKSYGFIKKI